MLSLEQDTVLGGDCSPVANMHLAVGAANTTPLHFPISHRADSEWELLQYQNWSAGMCGRRHQPRPGWFVYLAPRELPSTVTKQRPEARVGGKSGTQHGERLALG